MSSRRHIIALDLLRGVAAICVVIFHWLDGNSSRYFQASILAVDFFFALSGFVVSRAYADRLKAGMDLKEFLILRAIRLYPMVLLGTVLGVLRYSIKYFAARGSAEGVSWIAGHAVMGVVLLPDIFHPSAEMFILDAALWSLAFEFIAYGAYASIGFRLGRLSVAALLVLSGAGFWAWLQGVFPFGQAEPAHSLDGTQYLYALSRVAFSFTLGAAAQHLPDSLLRRFSLNGWIAGALLVLLFWCPARLLNGVTAGFAVAVGFPLMIVLCARSGAHIRLQTVASLLGDASYPIYAIHVPIMWTMGGLGKYFSRIWPIFSMSGGIYMGLVIVPLCIVSGYCAGRWIDTPVRAYLTARYRAAGRRGALT